jgi:hypothetical protein
MPVREFTAQQSKIPSVAQEVELQTIETPDLRAVKPILEREVRLWPGLTTEWESRNPRLRRYLEV